MKGLVTPLERYFPACYDRGGLVLVSLGLLSSILYVYTRIWYQGRFDDLPQNLMTLTFLISAWGQRQRLVSDRIFWMLGLSVVIPWLLFGINALFDYSSASAYRSANDLAKLFYFLPLAWWLGGSATAARRMLVIAFLGLITAIFMDPDLGRTLIELWNGKRIDFGIHNAQHGAFFFGLGLLFCLCRLFLGEQKPTLLWPHALLLLACLISLLGIYATQTRAAFLGLLVCGVIAVIDLARNRTSIGRSSTRWVIALFVFVAALLVWPTINIFVDRLAAERATLIAIVSGDLDQVPFTSASIRVLSWMESLNWIFQRPLTGWGLEARSDVIRLADQFPEAIRTSYGHLHNGYLELLIGFGLIGLVFFIAFWIMSLKRIGQAASADLYAFALYGSIFFGILNLFESFLFYWSGIFGFSLFMAAGYGQYLAAQLGGKPSLPHGNQE